MTSVSEEFKNKLVSSNQIENGINLFSKAIADPFNLVHHFALRFKTQFKFPCS